jgi:hypothetical protein
MATISVYLAKFVVAHATVERKHLHLDLLLDGRKPVADTVRAALPFAGDTLKNRINGANLPLLIEQLLRLVLQRELNLAENTAVEKAVTEILRMA